MKNYITLLTSLFILGTTIMKAQIPSCNYDPCESVAWTHFPTSFQFKQYHCEFLVDMSYKKCPPPNNQRIFKINYIAVQKACNTNVDDCAELEAWLNADDTHYQEVWEWAIEKLANLWLPDNYGQNQSDKCPDGGTYYIHTYLAGCTKYCIYDDNRPVSEGGGFSYVTQYDCGGGWCCKVNFHTCYDDVLNKVVTTKTSDIIGIPIVCPIVIGQVCPTYFPTLLPIPNTFGQFYNVPFTRSTGCTHNSCIP